MPVDIIWEDGNATVNIMCDGCDKEYEIFTNDTEGLEVCSFCLLYTSPSPRDLSTSRMPSSA